MYTKLQEGMFISTCQNGQSMDVDKGLNQILDLKALYSSAWTYITDIYVYVIRPEIPGAGRPIQK